MKDFEIYTAIVRHKRADLLVRTSDTHILGINFLPFKSMRARGNDLAEAAAAELVAFLDGRGGDFSALAFAFSRSAPPLFRAAMAAVCELPYGERWPYKELAFCLRTRAFQALGAALARNPFAVAIPAHRVLRSDADLAGFWGEKQREREASDGSAGALLRERMELLRQIEAQNPTAAANYKPPREENFAFIL